MKSSENDFRKIRKKLEKLENDFREVRNNPFQLIVRKNIGLHGNLHLVVEEAFPLEKIEALPAKSTEVVASSRARMCLCLL